MTESPSPHIARLVEFGEETPANPNPSYRNMVRMGFNLAYPRPNYQL